MTDLRKAAEMALEVLTLINQDFEKHRATLLIGRQSELCKASLALRQALAQPEQEPVTLLPDGSAFSVMSFPLPNSHWLYAEREYRDGEYEPIELGKPILTHKLRSAIVSAVRYAIRGATNCGKEMDFDPDALVQNAVYALCGPYTRHVDAVNMSQERVDETAKDRHEPFIYIREDTEQPFGGYEHCGQHDAGAFPVYLAPPKREWVGLTDREITKIGNLDWDSAYVGIWYDFAKAIEAKLKEKNT